MLKKLFISLIILSTIAAEGIINFPGNIYNILTCLNTDSKLNSGIKEKTEPSNKTDEKEVHFAAFKLTANSLKKLEPASDFKHLYNSKIIIGSEDIILNKYTPVSNRMFFRVAHEAKKTIVLMSSDNSPPQI